MRGAALVLAVLLAARWRSARAVAWCEHTNGAGCAASGLRVAVVVLNDRRASAVEDEMSVISHALYTHRHGYDLYLERCAPDSVMNVTHAAPHLLLKHIASRWTPWKPGLAPAAPRLAATT